MLYGLRRIDEAENVVQKMVLNFLGIDNFPVERPPNIMFVGGSGASWTMEGFIGIWNPNCLQASFFCFHQFVCLPSG